MYGKVRRVVTGHDESGKAIVVIDDIAPNIKERKAANVISTLLWVTDGTPADMSSNADTANRDIGVAPPANGSVLRIVDFPPTPGGATHDNAAMLKEMGIADGGKPARHPSTHRTKSIDYAIVLSGEIDMLMDDSEVHLKAGDIMVQQGTNHAWVNNGNEVCRIAFVLIDAHEPPAWKLTEGGGH
ncbi:MAG TPA: cupin domain-containing protein [Xanthobacteraceae bacterium]|nr:cupin domain-containing protein [Xanthobacteraceae bacterium]